MDATRLPSLWQEVQPFRRRLIPREIDGDERTVLFGAADAHVHAGRILSPARFTAGWHAPLRAYTEGILRGIEKWERKEPAALHQVARGGPDAGARATNGAAYARH